MKARARDILLAMTILVGLSGRCLGRIRVFAQVDTSEQIYVGDRFTYNIIIDGENKPGQVDLTPLAPYEPQSAGNHDVSQTSITIINGRTSRQTIKRYVMSYLLTASREGLIQLPPVTVEIDGVSYRTNPVQIKVLKPGTTDKLELAVSLSEQECYVGQPVIMTVKLYISAKIGDFRLDVPVLHDEENFFFENPDIVEPDAKQYRLSPSIPEPVLVTQRRVIHNGRDSILLSFSKVLIPRRSGRFQLEPASVSADVEVARSPGFWGYTPKYKRFMVTSRPLTLTVKALPNEAKPAGFYGLVGRYTISASATPTDVCVGDPITLTIKIGGSRYLKPIQWPELEKIPQMAANFKIPSQKASPAIEDGFKVFTQTIRAKNDKVKAIPPIPLAYFDPDAGRYVVVKTRPIKLNVAPTKILTGQDLQGRDFAPVNREVEAIKKGLSANYEGLDALKDMSFSPVSALISPAYAAIWALPLAVLLFSAMFKVLASTNPQKAALKRKRRACGKAVTRLKKAEHLDEQRRYEQIVSAMKHYIGERFDRTAGSLTADECYQIILAATDDAQAAEKFRQMMERFEAGRYAPLHVDNDAVDAGQVIELIRLIERKSKK